MQKSNWRSKIKRSTSFRDAVRHVRKRRPFGIRRKGQRGDLHTSPPSGTQPLGAGDDAASQGRQDNDFEAPQITQSAVLFPFRVEGYKKVSACTATIRFARRYQRRARMTVWQLALNFSAKEFFADCPPASIGLLRRAAETDREAANLLSVHPRSVDGAILLVHLLG